MKHEITTRFMIHFSRFISKGIAGKVKKMLSSRLTKGSYRLSVSFSKQVANHFPPFITSASHCAQTNHKQQQKPHTGARATGFVTTAVRHRPAVQELHSEEQRPVLSFPHVEQGPPVIVSETRLGSSANAPVRRRVSARFGRTRCRPRRPHLSLFRRGTHVLDLPLVVGFSRRGGGGGGSFRRSGSISPDNGTHHFRQETSTTGAAATSVDMD